MPSRIRETTQVIIIGAGPIGIELAVCLKRAGVPYLHFEAHQIGHTFMQWPRNTPFFSTTERIEIAGIPIQKTNQERTTGEEYLAYLRSVIEIEDLDIRAYEPVADIQPHKPGFLVITEAQTGTRRYLAHKIVFATGDMDFFNYLKVPGESLPHVSHQFTDPHLYFRRHLLIVGGKNSAVEAALRCWRSGARVTLSYRRSDFDARAVKHWLLPDFRAQIENGNIQFLPETRPVEFRVGVTVLENTQTGERQEVQNDFVLLLTGYTADSSLLEKAGVRLSGKERCPQYDPESMETNVPGIYVAGTVAAGTQTNYRLFIENTHVHVGKIVQALTGRWPDRLGTVPPRHYDQPLEDIQAN
ncbi:MAG TPA: NAD(P)-binding domain-containing protein [Anaerolineaceae bacterium]